MKRKIGFYRVKLNNQWIIGYCKEDCYWNICGNIGNINSDDWEDDEFEEINEQQIFPDKSESDEQIKDAISGMIRYGYQEAIDEISNFVSDNCEKIKIRRFGRTYSR